MIDGKEEVKREREKVYTLVHNGDRQTASERERERENERRGNAWVERTRDSHAYAI